MTNSTWVGRTIRRLQLRSPERVVQLFVVLVCSCVLGLTAWRVDLARDQALDAARVNTANLARSVAEHAHATIETADVITFGLVERVQYQGTSPEALARLHTVMVAKAAGVSRIKDLMLFGSDGNWLASSLPSNPPGVNVSDREYFIYHRDHPGLGLHISPPLKSRIDGRWNIHVTRRIDGPDGSFAGVAIATIDFDAVSRFYASFDIGPHGFITLANEAGLLLLREPIVQEATGMNVATSPSFLAYRQNGPTGDVLAVSKVDGVPRLTSFRKVEAYPLVTFVGLSQADILAGWKAGARTAYAAAAVITTVLSVFGWRVAGLLRARQLAGDAVRRSEQRYRLLADYSTDTVVQMGLDWRRVYVSPSSRTLLGYAPEEMIGQHPSSITHPDDQAALAENIRALGTNSAMLADFTYRVRHKDGHYIWVEPTGNRLADGQGYVVTMRDVSRRKAAEAKLHEANNQLQRMAMLDGLTGIANRRCFDLVVDKEYRRAVRSEMPLAVLLLDVDRFKAFNDTYGHPAGDACLRAIAGAIEGLSRRPADLAARYGGEEFAMLLPETDLAGAQALGDLVRLAVRRLGVVHSANPDQIATISIGAAVIWPRNGGPSSQDLVNMADAALYQAKASGRDRVCAHSLETMAIRISAL